ncbi:MAG TPA: sulfate ABC transporter substrate-binding protein [Gaiellaceae bacterium]|nr:sulfate ABC transporter substrate-binding protein [Gaiellaceae bacterium]
MRRISLTFLPLLILAAGLVVGAGAATEKTTISLVAYSTPKDAYAKIIPKFQGTAAGKDVSFNQSYGASGDQARAVAAGLDADIVALSLAPDVATLVKKGIVPGNWNENRFHGMVTNSVVVFVVRDGNPKKIRTWGDLARKGVEVVTPNPFTSGGARWNVMAAYGAQRAQGKTDKQAIDYLKRLFKNVPVLPKSAREATQVFASGKGDVLLTYENEAIYANKKGVHTEYVLPKQTILIENPVAVTKDGLKHSEVKAFEKFLWSSKAQKLFADTGYRPVLKSVASSPKYRFKKPKSLFTINSRSLGLRGWKSVQYRFFDHSNGIMVKVIGR